MEAVGGCEGMGDCVAGSVEVVEKLLGKGEADVIVRTRSELVFMLGKVRLELVLVGCGVAPRRRRGSGDVIRWAPNVRYAYTN